MTGSEKFKLIDLFCGAGGLSLGFGELFGHGFEPVWANDFNPYAAATYNRNFGDHCVVGDLVDLLEDPDTVIPAADIVIGGPPCQGFSLLNRNRNGDERRSLWRPFMEVVERAGAEVFVMENVPQLLNSEEYNEIEQYAQQLGFFPLAKAKLCAADYGVPQVRFRAFIIGCKFADPNAVFPPLKTHYNPALGLENLNRSEYVHAPQPWRTLRNVIADLPAPVGVEVREAAPPYDLHFGRSPTPISLRRYMAIPEEGMNRFDLQRVAPEITPVCWINKVSGGTDLFGRLWWDKPSVTIRTEFFKPEKGRYLHPSQHRPITHREAARIQSFPDGFRFTGSKIEIARQIGNAVPPQLAARVAGCVEALLEKGRNEKGAAAPIGEGERDMAENLQPGNTPELLRRELTEMLQTFEKELQHGDVRRQILALVQMFRLLRKLGASLIPVQGKRQAHRRIITHLLRNLQQVVDGDELMVVAGIDDWARRLRELRVEEGWWIYSGNTFRVMAENKEDAAAFEEMGIDPASIKPKQYVLMRPERDEAAAKRWGTLNGLRKKKDVAVKDKLIEYLRMNVGAQVTGEELAYLAKDAKEWARRVRELRTEEGWPIYTKSTGRVDLPVGVYVLEEDRQAAPHDRKIPDPVRVEVLDRDDHKCKQCGWDRGQLSPDDPRKMLELHHVDHHKDGGENTVENLVTLCNVCHDEVHRHDP